MTTSACQWTQKCKEFHLPSTDRTQDPAQTDSNPHWFKQINNYQKHPNTAADPNIPEFGSSWKKITELAFGRVTYLLQRAIFGEETADRLAINLTGGEVNETLPILTAVLHHWQCIHEVAVDGVQRAGVVIRWSADCSQVYHLQHGDQYVRIKSNLT